MERVSAIDTKSKQGCGRLSLAMQSMVSYASCTPRCITPRILALHACVVSDLSVASASCASACPFTLSGGLVSQLLMLVVLRLSAVDVGDPIFALPVAHSAVCR